MIDYNTYDYVKVGHYSNLAFQLSKSRTTTRSDDEHIELCSFMEPLIYKLALTHPEWTIVATEAHWDSYRHIWKASRFNLYEGNEYVGRILRNGYYEQDFKYEVHNDRIGKTRHRSGGKATKDLKKALKTIEEWFTPKTVEERRVTALEAMRGHTTNSEWRASRMLNDLFTRMMPAVATYIVNNMADARPFLESFGAPATSLDALPAQLDKAKGLWQVKAARDTNAGTTVVLMGDRYMLIPDKDPATPQTATASQLDPAMSGKIGVLKLFDKYDEAVEDVGMRIDPVTFYIIS